MGDGVLELVGGQTKIRDLNLGRRKRCEGEKHSEARKAKGATVTRHGAGVYMGSLEVGAEGWKLPQGTSGKPRVEVQVGFFLYFALPS